MKSSLVSIIIPTLNAQKALAICLESIKNQKYHHIEIFVVDGGSSDNTLKIAKKYNCIILKNPLKTAEAAKVVGVGHAQGKYIALIDSDNILPNNDWLKTMIEPLEHDSSLIGSEPWEFTYRPFAGFIERYSALIGANDPYAYVLGIYDRRNAITSKWTTYNLIQENLPGYLRVKLESALPVPTIGANGTIFRTDFLKKNLNSDYLFDVDIISQVLFDSQKPIYFAKVKIGIIHTYCESSISKFYRKQVRRLKDYYYYKKFRSFDYKNNFNQNPVYNLNLLIKNNLKFALYSFFIVPALVTSIKGYIRKHDLAWFFHPLACLITLYIYIFISLSSVLGFNQVQSRNSWHQ